MLRSLLVAVVLAVLLVPSTAFAASDRDVFSRGRTPCSMELPRVSWRAVKVSQRVRPSSRARHVAARVDTMRPYHANPNDEVVVAGRPVQLTACDL